MKREIIIIDYKVGNIGSIINMIKKIGYNAVLSGNLEQIERADNIIFPGVGSFDQGMNKLIESGLIPVLTRKVFKDKVPFLGICLGMQLLMEKSEEGCQNGLGWIPGQVKKFKFEDGTYKIPHMGWNNISPQNTQSLFMNLDEYRFYFVHSYYVKCKYDKNILGETEYGIKFSSAIVQDNIFGVQFHPEKSHRFGMALLKNFLEYF